MEVLGLLTTVGDLASLLMRKNFQLHKKINYSYEANRDFCYSVIIHCWLHVQFSAPAAIKVIFHTKTSDSVTRAASGKIEMMAISLTFKELSRQNTSITPDTATAVLLTWR